MEEKQLLQTIKILKEIKPNKKWIVLTKEKILAKDKEKKIFQIKWFSLSSLKKPIFLTGSLAGILLLVIFGIFTFINFFSFSHFSQPFLSSDYQNLIFSLQTLEKDIIFTTSRLQKINSEKALEVKEMVNQTVEKGEKLIVQTKNKVKINNNKKTPAINTKEKENVYSAIVGVEKAIFKLEQTYQESLKKLARKEIENLKKSTLTEKQKEILKEAETYFKSGKWEQALTKALETSQSR